MIDSWLIYKYNITHNEVYHIKKNVLWMVYLLINIEKPNLSNVFRLLTIISQFITPEIQNS